MSGNKALAGLGKKANNINRCEPIRAYLNKGEKRLLRYIIKRIILLIPVIIVVSFLIFLLMELAPGSPIDALLANMTDATEETIKMLEAQFGLDKPLIVRYGVYMLNLVQGSLGVSDISGIDVLQTYLSRLPYTLALAFGGISIGAIVAVPLGIRAAKHAGKLGDNATTLFTMIGMSMPGFWLAVLLIILFSSILGWLPAGDARHGIRSFILPCICSGLMTMATCTRQTRSSMLEVLNADFLRTARAKGVPEKTVINKHALGNALIPIMTNIGTALSISLAGSAVIEAAFTWPGVGRMVVEAVKTRDVKIATGSVIMTSILYVIINLMVDLAYGFVDPRIKSMNTRSRRKKLPPARKPVPAEGPAELIDIDEQVSTAFEDTFDLGQVPLDVTTESGPPIESDDAIGRKTAAAISQPDISAAYNPFEAGEEENAGEPPGEEDKKRSSVLHSTTYKNDEDVALVMKKYRKRSRMGEIMHHISKNKGAMAGLVIIIALLLTVILGAIFISFEDITKSNVPMRYSAPGANAFFGTDNMGRDLFKRVIYGTRYSLLIGVSGASLAAFFGIILGCFAAFYGRVVEDVIMRIADVMASIPGLLAGMVIVTVLGQGSIPNLIIAIGVPGIHIFLRMTRASVLTIRDKEFVEASRAMGLSRMRTLFTHVLPNGLAPIIVQFTTMLGTQILVGASLSFLGFGVPAPHPEWGTLVSAGRADLRIAPWLTTFPGLFIMITVLAFNLLGDGLRDALDPKLKK